MILYFTLKSDYNEGALKLSAQVEYRSHGLFADVNVQSGRRC